MKRLSLRGHGTLRPLWLDVDYRFIMRRGDWKVIYFAKGHEIDRFTCEGLR